MKLRDLGFVVLLVLIGGLIVGLFNVSTVNTTTELNDILMSDVKRQNETIVSLNDIAKRQEVILAEAREILITGIESGNVDLSVIMKLNARNWQLPEPKKSEQEQEQEQK